LSIKLDDLELVKRVAEEANSRVNEIRTLQAIHVKDKRDSVELEIPGSIGNLIQDMGTEPVVISVFGEMIGEYAWQTLEKIKAKYDTNEPFDFTSDLVEILEINKVILKQFYFEQIAGSADRFRYHMVLKEYNEPAPSEQEEAQEQDGKVKSDIYYVNGKLTGLDGKPYPGITVYLEGPKGKLQAITDNDGFYEFFDVPEGHYKLYSDAEGYEDMEREFEVKKKSDGG
jgi:hypothetical protein